MPFLRIASIALLLAASPAIAAPGEIVAEGVGKAVATPDTVFMNIAVDSEEKTPEAVMAANAATIAKVTAVLKGLGVDARDLQTSNYSLSPHMGPDGCGQSYNAPAVPCTLEGFKIGNTLTVRVRQIDKFGAILGATVEAGLENMYGITLTIADPKPYEQQAYAAALLAAKAKAELTAKTLGVTLGAIKSVQEGVIGYDDNRPATLADGVTQLADGEADLAVLIEKGQLTFNRKAQITYEIAE